MTFSPVIKEKKATYEGIASAASLLLGARSATHDRAACESDETRDTAKVNSKQSKEKGGHWVAWLERVSWLAQSTRR